VADDELDRGMRRRFVAAFADTMHSGGAGRKRGYVLAGAVAVAVSAGVAVAVGAAGSHHEPSASEPARLSALARHATASPSAVKSVAAVGSRKVSVPGSATPPSARQPIADPAGRQPGSGNAGPPPPGHVPAQSTPPSATSRHGAASSSPPSPSPSAKPRSNPAEDSGTVEVTGQVSCLSGNSVEGVWVQAGSGKGWADWKKLGNGSTSDWWYWLPVNEPYALHVGCGGSPSAWSVATYSPTVSGLHNSFNCYDVADKPDFRTCVLR